MNIARIVALLVVFLSAGSAQATSDSTQITRATLRQMPISITVSITRARHGSRFRVIVGRKPGIPYHFVGNAFGWLEDVRESGENHGGPGSLSVKAIQKSGNTVFIFFVINRDLTRKRFCFGYAGYNTGTRIMPSADLYWFNLSAFAPAKTPKKLVPLFPPPMK